MCLITMLIVASCASVGCFQCPLFGLPDRTLLRGRAREGERPLNNVLIVSFSQHSELCSGYRDSCLIYSPKGTAGDRATFVCGPRPAAVPKRARSHICFYTAATLGLDALRRRERLISSRRLIFNSIQCQSRG